jgi:undecaprenyl-diphosphatase
LPTLFEIMFLAIIQGLTEWLPISSSGHLVLAQKYLGLNLPLVFSVMLHTGTVIVVLVAFRKDIADIVKTLVKREFETEEGKMVLFIAVGSVPLALIGLFLHDFFESLFSNLLAVGLALLATGVILFFSEKRRGNRKLGFLDSLIIGVAQAVAIMPGVSRSGMTVTTGLLRKIDKVTAFKYSFLLSIPAILGATVLELGELVVGTVDVVPLFLGVIVSMIVGFASLKLLQRIVMREKFHLFAYYCWIVGLAVIFFTIYL